MSDGIRDMTAYGGDPNRTFESSTTGRGEPCTCVHEICDNPRCLFHCVPTPSSTHPATVTRDRETFDKVVFAFERLLWREREGRTDPYCALCGAGWGHAQQFGHLESCEWTALALLRADANSFRTDDIEKGDRYMTDTAHNMCSTSVNDESKFIKLENSKLAPLTCPHDDVAGGNDYMHCLQCDLQWDYRKMTADQATLGHIRALLRAAETQERKP